MEYNFKLIDRKGYEYGYFETEDDIKEHIALLEEENKEDGTYKPDFYIILTPGEGEKTRLYFAECIKGLRFMNGISQAQLAEAAGTNQFHISKIESGAVSPTIDVLARIAAALGKRIDLVD